jgi:tRNA A-37 threonylcarbamoyl transferase component Bud32
MYYIKQLELTKRKPNGYKLTECSNKSGLQRFLAKHGYDVELGVLLKGGIDSSVYSAIFNKRKIIIKHTEDRANSIYFPPFSEIDFYVDRKNQNVDSLVLKKLKGTSIRVPSLIKYFPETSTALMEDLRESGFVLMLDQIIDGNLKEKTAECLGDKLAELILLSRKWKSFKCYKNPRSQIFERGLELRLAFPNTQVEYKKLESRFLNNSKNWLWPDAHPKNIFVNNESGEVAFIDFGGSYWGDQEFLLPNFIGQLIIYVICGYIDIEFSEKYINKILIAYKKKIPINEELFCKYVGMEILHRSMGKWIQGVETTDNKVKNINVGISIFDGNINTFVSLFDLIRSVVKY